LEGLLNQLIPNTQKKKWFFECDIYTELLVAKLLDVNNMTSEIKVLRDIFSIKEHHFTSEENHMEADPEFQITFSQEATIPPDGIIGMSSFRNNQKYGGTLEHLKQHILWLFKSIAGEENPEICMFVMEVTSIDIFKKFFEFCHDRSRIALLYYTKQFKFHVLVDSEEQQKAREDAVKDIRDN